MNHVQMLSCCYVLMSCWLFNVTYSNRDKCIAKF